MNTWVAHSRKWLNRGRWSERVPRVAKGIVGCLFWLLVWWKRVALLGVLVGLSHPTNHVIRNERNKTEAELHKLCEYKARTLEAGEQCG